VAAVVELAMNEMNDKFGADSRVYTNGPSVISIINDAGTRLVLSCCAVVRPFREALYSTRRYIEITAVFLDQKLIPWCYSCCCRRYCCWGWLSPSFQIGLGWSL